MKIILPILLILINVNLFGQINTELIRKEYGDVKSFYQLDASILSVSGNSEHTKFSLGGRVDRFEDKYYFFMSSQSVYDKGKKEVLTNRAFLHLRFVYYLSDIFLPEMFLQNNFDKSILLDKRYLVGVGLREQILNINPVADSLAKLLIAVGTGVFWEYEDLSTYPYEKTMLRSNIYLNVNWQFNPLFSLLVTGYLHNSLKEIEDYRILSDAGLKIKITKNLGFNFTLHYLYDNEPNGDLKRADLEILNSLSINF